MSLSREEIIRMAREAGFNVSEYTGGKLAGKLSIFDYADVDIFIEVERSLNSAYAAGSAAEREQCAMVCEELVVHEPKQEHPLFIAGQHRAKRNCAAAIRARGDK